jgi:ribonuclease HI
MIAVVHADESCLGNGQDGTNPGGAGMLIEVESQGAIVRRDLYLASPDTTNNRMALSGAIATMALLSGKGKRLTILYVSDSEYLVKGMREWVPSWRARGWKRKGGAVENLELWQTLLQVASRHQVTWRWVRGHAGDPKNEYADHVAVRAAEDQTTSDGAVTSEFPAWLEERRARGQFGDYDPDVAFRDLASELR